MPRAKKQPQDKRITIPALEKRVITIEVIGTEPLITHRFSEKARKQMEDKQQGRARQKKLPKVPQEEYDAAFYKFADGKGYGIPAAAFKKAMVAACRHVEGIPMTVAKGAFHVYGDGKSDDAAPRDLVRIQGSKPKMRCDIVRVANGNPDLRYRPEWAEWRVKLRIAYVASSLSDEEIINLLNVAGFAVGVGENRPERSGDTNGQFQVAA